MDDLVFEISFGGYGSSKDAVLDVSADVYDGAWEDNGVLDAVAGDGRVFADDDRAGGVSLDGGGLVNVISAREEEAGFEIGVQGAGVEPGSFELARQDGFALVNEGLDGVGDLVLAACGRLESWEDRPDFGSKEVETGHCEVGLGVLGLFDEFNDAVPFDVGDSESGRVFNRHDEVEVRAAGRLEFVFELGERAVVDCVAQIENEGVASDELFGKAYGVGKPLGFWLTDEGELDAEFGAVAEPFSHRGFVFADDDADFRDPHLLHSIEGVLHRDPVRQREKRLRD